MTRLTRILLKFDTLHSVEGVGRLAKLFFQRVCGVIRQDKEHLLHILLGCPAQVCLTGGLFYMCLFLSFLHWLFSCGYVNANCSVDS